ncbi:MAG: hypothetical protein LBT00_04540 [Spirochaetaceae bacterium]|nr:hypothetical protein [Spirochaetaceae bacterium]
MRFHKMIAQNKFTLVASLPENNLALAEAALKGGAEAIKVHVNVWHRASGHTFGSFAENRQFLRELVRLCGDTPVGLVPGGGEAFISVEERDEIEALGIDFFSAYAAHLPNYMMDSKSLSRMAAIDSNFSQNTLDGINRYPPDVLECSIQPGEAYNEKLRYADILSYAGIAARVKIPVLIPTQKWMSPGEVPHLFTVGCKALMIGAVVMGKDPCAAEVEKTCAAFRGAIRDL